MKFVFLMDPLENVVKCKDTSYILMLEAHRRGYDVYFVPDGGMSLNDGRLSFHATKVIPQQDGQEPFVVQDPITLQDTAIDSVFIRNDPPFDAQYLMNTWLLEHLPAHIPVINKPGGIRTVNEKLWCTQFSELIPPTIVSANKEALQTFIIQHKKVVAKPTDGFGGQSVFFIEQGDSNTNVILEQMTSRFTKEIIVQKFVEEASQGDKRITLLNGEPLAAVLRVHAAGEHRNNFFAGGKPTASNITDRDKKIIAVLKPHLQKLGLYFVGIDIMGDYLIEVNVTSPTCIQEMNRLYDTQLEAKVIDFAEQLIKSGQPAKT